MRRVHNDNGVAIPTDPLTHESKRSSVISVFNVYSSVVPDDAAESVEDSGTSEPNSGTSDGANVGIENWQPIDADLLVGINKFNTEEFDAFSMHLLSATYPSPEIPSWEELSASRSKPFQLDSSFYGFDEQNDQISPTRQSVAADAQVAKDTLTYMEYMNDNLAPKDAPRTNPSPLQDTQGPTVSTSMLEYVIVDPKISPRETDKLEDEMIFTDSGYCSRHRVADNRHDNRQDDDDSRTSYLAATSLDAANKTNYISELSQDIYSRICHQVDLHNWAALSTYLPDLLEAFALKIGHESASGLNRDIMYFVHNNRQYAIPTP
jgi:hypothetical protein